MKRHDHAAAQVTVTPQHSDGSDLEHFAKTVYRTGTTDPQTPCGCSGSSGTPTGFQTEQFKGRILFEWEDQSQCESAFTFTRNGVGLSARFDVTEQQACGAKQAPKSVYDDLTIQSGSLLRAVAACHAHVCVCVCVCVCVPHLYTLAHTHHSSTHPPHPLACILCHVLTAGGYAEVGATEYHRLPEGQQRHR